MTRPQMKTGMVKYTGRALLQDAQEAMGGNIVSGLIELITNADDAYARLGNSKRGRINIEVEHRRKVDWKVVIRDRATGMSRDELEKSITRIGERSSGFEKGLNVRGNRGRGAKDLVAFGPVEFESVQDGFYSKLRLEKDGEFQVNPRPSKVTERQRKRLGIQRGNGTVVTVFVARTIRCPLHENLMIQLQRHFQLRDIMADPDREVYLVNVNDKSGKSTRKLFYQVDESEVVVDQPLEIEGYPEASAHLRLSRLPERCDDHKSDPTRPSGILVKGQKAIYANSLFSYEGKPHAGWYAGSLICPYIDDLAREFDDRVEKEQNPSKSNPLSPISRRREGLAPDHPFTKALTKAVDAVLRERIKIEEERERSESSGIENQDTKRTLNKMAREVSRFMYEAMREMEYDMPSGMGDEVGPLAIVPPEAVVRIGEEKTLSVFARSEGLFDGAKVVVQTEPEGVVEVLDGTEISLRPDRRRENVLSGQIHLRPLIEDETIVTATVDDREAIALITVRPPIEDEEFDDPEAELPEALEFERNRYQVRWNKTKRISIRAPLKLAEDEGTAVVISSSDEGVVIVGGSTVRLKLDESESFLVGECRIQGRKLGAKARLRASIGEQYAECRVSVSERDEGLPNLEFKLVDKTPSVYRALFEPSEPEPGEKQILEVYARHPTLRSYLGNPPDYEGQNTPEWKALLAEVVTEASVRRIVTLRYGPGRPGADDVRPDEIYHVHFEYSSRLLPMLQKLFRA